MIGGKLPVMFDTNQGDTPFSGLKEFPYMPHTGALLLRHVFAGLTSTCGFGVAIWVCTMHLRAVTTEVSAPNIGKATYSRSLSQARA